MQINLFFRQSDNNLMKNAKPSPSPSKSVSMPASVLESAVDPIIAINDRGIIRSVNLATERLFGFTTDENDRP